MAYAKFQINRFKIDGGEIAENHAILVNLTASIYIDLHFTDKPYTPQ